MAWLGRPPSERLATAGLRALPVIQLMPSSTLEVVPAPLQSSTRTAVRGAPGATPTTPSPSSRAAIVPATCVPWPAQSSLVPPARLTLPTRLRSGCAAIPVSRT